MESAGDGGRKAVGGDVLEEDPVDAIELVAVGGRGTVDPAIPRDSDIADDDDEDAEEDFWLCGFNRGCDC